MPNTPRYLRIAPPRTRKRYHPRWRVRRARHLSAYPLCPCGRAATEVDHIDGNTRNNRTENLQSYCKSCHSKKTVRHDGGLSR